METRPLVVNVLYCIQMSNYNVVQLKVICYLPILPQFKNYWGANVLWMLQSLPSSDHCFSNSGRRREDICVGFLPQPQQQAIPILFSKTEIGLFPFKILLKTIFYLAKLLFRVTSVPTPEKLSEILSWNELTSRSTEKTKLYPWIVSRSIS